MIGNGERIAVLTIPQQKLALVIRAPELIVPALLLLSPKHQLWIVEPDRIRYREE